MKIKVLIADDDPDILDFTEYNLVKEGFEVHCARNGKEALKEAFNVHPEIIILDVMMPEMDGVEVCSELRGNGMFKNTLIIFSSARAEDFTQISAYNAGADDYFVKPIKPKIFLSRINALLKRRIRIEGDEEHALIQVGNISINKESLLVMNKDIPIKLVKKEFELLVLLATKPGKVFTRDEIIDTIWDSNVIVGNRTIDVHIRKLREKIGSQYFETIKGIGYKFIIVQD